MLHRDLGAIGAAIMSQLLTKRALRYVFYLTIFCLPLSAEVALPGGLGTDLFGEPMLWVLTMLTLLVITYRGVPLQVMRAIYGLLMLHLLWILVATIFAQIPMISFKYWLAKLWYVLPLAILPHYIITKPHHIRQVIKCYLAGLFMGAGYYFVQHAMIDFDYAGRVNAGNPIWRNHVNYACCLVLSLPMIYYVHSISKSRRVWYLLMSVVVLLIVQYAYARIAYICMAAALVYIIVLRLRLTVLVFLISSMLVLGGVLWLESSNRYLHLAPEYTEAITQQDFGSKIAATAKGQDISSMERVHRWVAGKNMISDHGWIGLGPANFYETYRPYAVYSFETYVSDNPERSGIHNYFLMVLVEQGWIGLILWAVLLLSILLLVERRYHTSSPSQRSLYLMIGVATSMIIVMNMVNDLIEVVKIGGVFFLMISLLTIDVRSTTSLSDQ